MTDHTSERDGVVRAADYVVRGYVLLGAGALLFALLGQALTGGVRTSTPPGPVPADAAAVMAAWLVAAIYCALSPRKGGSDE